MEPLWLKAHVAREIEVRMRRTPIILLSVFLIILIVVAYIMMDPQAAQSVLVDFGLAEPEAEGYEVTGILEAQITYLGSVNGGRIQELPVHVGEKVNQGAILVKLETTLLEPLLDAAEARYEAAQAQLDLLQADPRKVDLVVAKAAVTYATAIFESANQALSDTRTNAPDSLREDQIAIAQAAVEQAKAGVELAVAQLLVLENGPTENQIEGLQVLVDAAEADVAAQQFKLQDQIIEAPFEGVILDLFMLPGELALPGQVVVTIADLDTLKLSVYIPEADLGWAQLGDEVQLSIDAYPDRLFTGEVIFIADQAEFTPRNVQTPEERVILVYEVQIQVSNSDGALKPGLPAEVTFGGTS